MSKKEPKFQEGDTVMILPGDCDCEDCEDLWDRIGTIDTIYSCGDCEIYIPGFEDIIDWDIYHLRLVKPVKRVGQQLLFPFMTTSLEL